jgi:hypothetical protein
MVDTRPNDVHKRGLMTGSMVFRRDGAGVTTLTLKLTAVTEQPDTERRRQPRAALWVDTEAAVYPDAVRLLSALAREASSAA